VYRYDDDGGVDQSSGEPFAYETLTNLELSIESGNAYRAAVGFGATWTGTTSGGPIDGFRVFNYGGGDASDVAFDNLIIGPTTLVPLSLEVNKANNIVKIKGNPSLLANIDYYEITSVQNGLNTLFWNSLDQQNISAVDGTDPGGVAGDTPTEGWDKSPTATNGVLREYFLRPGGAPLAAGGELTLGAAYNQSVFGTGNGDVQFSYGIAGGARLTGTVSYIGVAGVAGDYNGNSVVDAPDFTTWKTGFGNALTPGTSPDGSGNGHVDGPDFLLWQRRFGATTAVPANHVVPEPQTLMSLAPACAVIGASRRKSHVRH
jgi:hypothetical protein